MAEKLAVWMFPSQIGQAAKLSRKACPPVIFGTGSLSRPVSASIVAIREVNLLSRNQTRSLGRESKRITGCRLGDFLAVRANAGDGSSETLANRQLGVSSRINLLI